MKTLLSLVMVSVLFTTQSIGFCEVSKTALPNEAQDIRQLLSQKLIDQGKYFETLAQKDPQLAEQAFDAMIKTNIDDNLAFIQSNIETISEEEAQLQIETLKNLLATSEMESAPNTEKISTTISNRTLTARQKLVQLMENSSLENIQHSIDQLKNKIKLMGYEKTFSDLAEEIRSRSYDSYQKQTFLEKHGPDIANGFLITLVLLVVVGSCVYLTMYFTSMALKPAIALWVVLFGFGLGAGG